MSARLRRIAEAEWFQSLVVAVILLSAMLAGIDSYPWVQGPYALAVNRIEGLILALFVVELMIRIGAHGTEPWRFFRNGWNLFDFTIIAVCFLPNAQFAAVLRMLRMLRILRLLRLVNRAKQAEIYRLKHEDLARAHHELVDEQEKSERLLLNILPMLVAQRLKEGEKVIADSFPEASVLFADIVGFTDFSARITPEALVNLLDGIFSRFDHLAEHHGLEKIKTIGDAYMVVAGVPFARPDHAQATAEMALDMQSALAAFNRERGTALQLRIGIHSGPVVAGVIGQKKFIYDLWGDTVNTASRMESHSLPGRIQITGETRAQLPAGYQVEPRGMIRIKGKGEMETYFLLDRDRG